MINHRVKKDQKQNPFLAKDLTRKFNIVYGGLNIPTIIYDTETLEILDANSSALRFYGISKDDCISMVAQKKSAILKKNCMINILPKLTQYVDYINSWKHYDKSGNLNEMQITCYSLTLAEKNVRVVMIKDVTIKKQLQQNLIKSIN